MKWLHGFAGQPDSPSMPLGQHQEPTHLSSKEIGGPDRKEECAQDRSTEPQTPFPMVTEDHLEQHSNGYHSNAMLTALSTKAPLPAPNPSTRLHNPGI